MKNVETCSGTFNVQFHKHHRGTRRKRVVDSVCVISTVDPTKKGKDKYTLYRTAISKHNHVDEYSKVTGKRFALIDAIIDLDRDVRIAIFNQFDKEFKDCK